jgi:serine phosphatase RsbU (regulator of sigma subunit)
MEQINTNIDEELRVGAQYLAQRLMPAAGAIPHIPGIEIFGRTIPLNGIVGGDLISYVNFQERYDLDARIRRALALAQGNIAQALQRLKRKGGMLVADVAGHRFTDAARALMLQQAFQTAALYEMDLNGELTLRLFEQVNTRFCKSATLRNLAAGSDAGSFITLIYGEISSTGRFRFVSAGHPPPLVFSREFDRFVDISADRMVSYPPIGLQLSEDQIDARQYQRVLGYKKRYTSNDLNLMGQGDVLLLYTDGLLDPLCGYTLAMLERAVSRSVSQGAEGICESILVDHRNQAEQNDDISLVVIKYR